MLIRPLTKDDILDALPMINEFCMEMGFPFDMVTLVEFMKECLDKKWMLDVVEDDQGNFIGMGGVKIVSHFADKNHLMGVEFVWHSLPTLPSTHRAKIMLLLWNRMEVFCKLRRVPLIIGVNEKGKSGKLGERMTNKGYSLEESYFIKEDL